MGKILLFVLLWRLLGNPVMALIVLFIVFYLVDRRYIGLFPSVVKPIRRQRMIRKQRLLLLLNPHDTSAKHELARLLMESGRYSEAQSLLLSIGSVLDTSAEYWAELGICALQCGEGTTGEVYISKGLAINQRVKYGQPLIRLAEAFAATDSGKALAYLQMFREIQSSSCEAYYMLGNIYRRLGQPIEALASYREGLLIYRSLPKYKKRQERSWALRCWIRSIFSS